MDNKGNIQKNKAELRKVISSLETVSLSIRKDFSSVGNDRCSDSINSIIRRYKSILKRFDHIY